MAIRKGGGGDRLPLLHKSHMTVIAFRAHFDTLVDPLTSPVGEPQVTIAKCSRKPTTAYSSLKLHDRGLVRNSSQTALCFAT